MKCERCAFPAKENSVLWHSKKIGMSICTKCFTEVEGFDPDKKMKLYQNAHQLRQRLSHDDLHEFTELKYRVRRRAINGR